MVDMLVPGDQSSEWMQTHSLQAGLDASCGRQSDFSGIPHASNAIGHAHTAVKEAIETSKALAGDTTRTPDARHDAAQRFVDKRAATIEQARNTLVAQAETLLNEGEEIVRDTFKPDPSKVMLDTMLHQHIHMLATTKEDGPNTIRELISDDIDVAKVLFSSKPYLLGINAGVLTGLKGHAVKVHAPKAAKMFDTSDRLLKTASNYPQVIRSMKAALYNGAIAARARSTRVDV